MLVAMAVAIGTAVEVVVEATVEAGDAVAVSTIFVFGWVICLPVIVAVEAAATSVVEEAAMRIVEVAVGTFVLQWRWPSRWPSRPWGRPSRWPWGRP